ncbi:MAG: alpha/beta fold hydrolase [Halomonadaceae bacterium]|nr:MAG: alpha/beta fold hydrolase [Halomonadaceae bacterium]
MVPEWQVNQDSLLPLVLISGWGQPVHWIKPVLPGGLPWVQAWSLEDFTPESPEAWVAQAMAVAPQRAVWMGWSLGGQLAMAAARDYPQRVAGVITLCATPGFVATEDWPHGRPAAEFDDFARRCRRNPGATLRRFSHLQSRGDRYEAQAQQQGPASQSREASRELNNSGLLQTLDWLRHTDQRDLWRQPLVVPRLHLFGERDPLVAPQTGNALGLARQQQQLLPGLAHWPFGPHLPGLHTRLQDTLSRWSTGNATQQ